MSYRGVPLLTIRGAFVKLSARNLDDENILHKVDQVVTMAFIYTINILQPHAEEPWRPMEYTLNEKKGINFKCFCDNFTFIGLYFQPTPAETGFI